VYVLLQICLLHLIWLIYTYRVFNVADCLTSFIEVEELAETELYYCNNCKSKQRSTKRFWIRRLPNVSLESNYHKS
jgi:ubiquitin C-terminal hydrolase